MEQETAQKFLGARFIFLILAFLESLRHGDQVIKKLNWCGLSLFIFPKQRVLLILELVSLLTRV